jgi:hypothetical protein
MRDNRISNAEAIMQLEGSCYCGTVKFSVAAYAPVPFLRCYCSICRKSAGGGGYAINLGAKAETLKVTGEKNIAVFHAVIDGEKSEAKRHFCKKCGTALWVFDPRWPDLVHPFASAIDSDLPVPPQHVHMMLGSKANWVEPQIKKGDDQFDEYPEQSLEDWHKAHHLLKKV